MQKVLLKTFHVHGHTIGFLPQTVFNDKKSSARCFMVLFLLLLLLLCLLEIQKNYFQNKPGGVKLMFVTVNLSAGVGPHEKQLCSTS